MANVIKIKKSGTTGATPNSLELGELSLNYTDGKLFYKDNSNNIKNITETKAFFSETAPSNPIQGNLWYRASNGRTYIYYDSTWVDLGSGGTGIGIPSGGSINQVLAKASSGDYDTEWKTTVSPGLVLLNTTSVYGITSSGVEIESIFSSSYPMYKIFITEASATTDTYLYFRLSSSGTPNSTASSYIRRGVWMKSLTIEATTETSNLCFLGFIGTSGKLSLTGDLINPNLTTPTEWSFNIIDRNTDSFLINGRHTQSASYNGLYLYSAAGSCDLKIKVYGYVA